MSGLNFKGAIQTLHTICHRDEGKILRRLTPLLWNLVKIFSYFCLGGPRGKKIEFSTILQICWFLFRGFSTCTARECRSEAPLGTIRSKVESRALQALTRSTRPSSSLLIKIVNLDFSPNTHEPEDEAPMIMSKVWKLLMSKAKNATRKKYMHTVQHYVLKREDGWKLNISIFSSPIKVYNYDSTTYEQNNCYKFKLFIEKS
jgi:hypothetical protein